MNKGMTLLEVMFASAILAACTMVALSFMGKFADDVDLDLQVKEMEFSLQDALDTVVFDLKEAKP